MFIKKVKRQLTDQEKIYANYISDDGFVSRINKEPSIVNNKKVITWF